MIDAVVDAVAQRLPADSPPLVVGIAGGVGVGKTTLAGQLATALTAAPQGASVAVVSTDNFLLPNVDLDRLGLAMRKGFPESYDEARLVAAVASLRAGGVSSIPVYDHDRYDVLDSLVDVEPTDVLVLEGVNALQPAIAAILDVSFYLDADEDTAEAWFHERFRERCESGIGFYAPLHAMSEEQRTAIADGAWRGINVVNLREHITPTRERADYVLRARDA